MLYEAKILKRHQVLLRFLWPVRLYSIASFRSEYMDNSTCIGFILTKSLPHILFTARSNCL